MLSVVKTLEKYRSSRHTAKRIKQGENQNRELTEKQEQKLKKRRLIKMVINYCASVNAAFLLVGSLSETYYYGVRIIGNVISVVIGYIYAYFIVQPFLYSLDEDIKTPYQYFEKRYRSKLARSVSSLFGLFFYFCVLSLYIWASMILLTTLMPQIPLWGSSLIVGIFSIIGSTIGGFTQTTITNSVQFIILVLGLTAAITLTLTTSVNSAQELYDFAYSNGRTVFFDLRTDITVRYTLLNQLVSLPLPWCTFYSMLIPNFKRYRSVRGKRLSKTIMISNVPLVILVNSMVMISGGFLGYVFFYGCDPLKANQIVNKNQVGPYWILMILAQKAPSVCGILFSSMICYAAIQHSIGIPICASTLFDETIRPLILCKIKLKEALVKKIKLALTVLLGLLSILFSISFQYAKNTMLSLFFLFNNSTNSPILGFFLLAAFNPYANAFGAITAFVSNLAINYWLGLGALVFSSLKSQEFPTDTSLCEIRNYNMNYSSFDYTNYYSMTPNSTSAANQIYYPENPVLFYLYSIASIWYCLFSVLYTFLMGSLFSLIYSLVKTRTLDSDRDFKEERRHYLFFFRMKERKCYDFF